MRINLNCPFEERFSASVLGARWDIARRTWYVIDPPDLKPFARWLPADVRAFLLKTRAKPKKRRPSQERAAIKKAKHQGNQDLPPGVPAGDPPW